MLCLTVNLQQPPAAVAVTLVPLPPPPPPPQRCSYERGNGLYWSTCKC
jgi:hypothetical protein